MPVKSLMKAVGLPAGDLRRPLRALEGAALARGLAAVRSLGLDSKYGYKVPMLDIRLETAPIPGNAEGAGAAGSAGSCVLG